MEEAGIIMRRIMDSPIIIYNSYQTGHAPSLIIPFKWNRDQCSRPLKHPFKY